MVAVPVAGAPILDSWGADVANALNRIKPIVMTADQATDSATAVNVTELELEMIAGRQYNLQLFGGYFVNATNQGLKLSWSGPGHSQAALAMRRWGAGGPTTEDRYRTTSGALVGATTTDATGIREWWAAIRYTASASGTFRLTFARGGTSGGVGVTLTAGSGGLCIEYA